MSKPKKSFAELNKAELVAAAERYGSLTEGTNEVIRAGLLEDGITWEQYAKDFGLVEEPEVNTQNVVKSEDVAPKNTGSSVGPHLNIESEVNNVTTVTTETNPLLPQGDMFLIKMVRDNPYFEYKHYKFTQENPYNVMNLSDAQSILTEEEGFSQATPLEAKSYFD